MLPYCPLITRAESEELPWNCLGVSSLAFVSALAGAGSNWLRSRWSDAWMEDTWRGGGTAVLRSQAWSRASLKEPAVLVLSSAAARDKGL